jgi:hypothetical protein
VQAELYERQEDCIVVEVIDNSGSLHRVEIKPDGSIQTHRQNDYPLGSENRTDEQERIFQQVEARAKYHVHRETDYDVLSAAWNPEEIPRAIEALENLPIQEFTEQFRDFYKALVHTDEFKNEENVCGNVVMVMKSFCYDEELSIPHVDPDVRLYYREDGETNKSGAEFECPPNTTRMTLVMAPIREINREFDYPEDFRDLCVNNLICQIRDIYRNMGEEPPADVDIEGYGKPTTLADGLISRPDE